MSIDTTGRILAFKKWAWNRNQDIFISQQFNFIYISTPKVASTSIKWWFSNIHGIKKSSLHAKTNEQDKDLDVHHSLIKLTKNVRNITRKEFYSKKYYRFAIVRNPYTRIFSAWASKILIYDPLIFKSFLHFGSDDHKIMIKKDIAVKFEKFLKYISKNKTWDPHFTDQFGLLRPDLIPYNKVFRLENKNELIRKMGSRDLKNPFSKKSNEALISFRPEYITAKSESIIKKLYKRDFKYFKYSLQKPNTIESKLSNKSFNQICRLINTTSARNKKILEARICYTKSNKFNLIYNKISNLIKKIIFFLDPR